MSGWKRLYGGKEWVPYDLVFQAFEDALTDWPEQIEVERWERNEKGERRIAETRTYKLVALPKIVKTGENSWVEM